jgi:mannose-6-phosphate isomerase-like protein (cupin superfamily)
MRASPPCWSRSLPVRSSGKQSGALAALALGACGGVDGPAPAAVQATNDAPFVVRHDRDVMVKQPGPHEGTGETTAYRYFDDVRDPGVVFRKRALHPGASIGMHVLTHDEVYYVLTGRGALTVDGTQHDLGAGTAVFMRIGTDVELRQVGPEDLVIIIAYPPAR